MINRTLISMMLVIASGCSSSESDSYFSGIGKSIANGDLDENRLLINSPRKTPTSYMDAVQDVSVQHAKIDKDSVGAAVYGSIESVVAAGYIAKEINGKGGGEFTCKTSGSMKLFYNSGLKHIRFNKCKSDQLIMDGIISFKRIDDDIYERYSISMDMKFGDLSGGGVRAVSDNSSFSTNSALGRVVSFNGAITVNDQIHAFNTNGMLYVKTNTDTSVSGAGRLSDGVFLVSNNSDTLNPGSAWVAQSATYKTIVTSPSGVESEFDMSDINF